MALSPDGKTLYVVQRKLNQIAKVDTASLNIVKTARLGLSAGPSPGFFRMIRG